MFSEFSNTRTDRKRYSAHEIPSLARSFTGRVPVICRYSTVFRREPSAHAVTDHHQVTPGVFRVFRSSLQHEVSAMNARHDGLSKKMHAKELLCLPHTDPECSRIWGGRFQVIAGVSTRAVARVGTPNPNRSRAAASRTCLLRSLAIIRTCRSFLAFLVFNIGWEPRNILDAQCRF
jgi:hypothetical protein